MRHSRATSGAGEDYDKVNQFAVGQLQPAAEQFYDTYFKGHKMLPGTRGDKVIYGDISTLESDNIYLPWPRLFEVKIDPSVAVTFTPGLGNQ